MYKIPNRALILFLKGVILLMTLYLKKFDLNFSLLLKISLGGKVKKRMILVLSRINYKK